MNLESRSARVIAVTSGKGGVGKTNVAVNLAVALAAGGQRTMLVDCDLGLANANILLGLNSEITIADLFGGRSMDELVIEGPEGLSILPGHSGLGLARLADTERGRLATAFRPYAEALEYVVVDTASGIAPESLGLVAASDTILIVLSPEPTAFMDAYSLVKALALRDGCTDFGIVANMVADERAGRTLFDHFKAVAARFLPVACTYLGAIPDDPFVREAVLRKRCLMETFPSSPAGAAFTRLAGKLTQREAPMLAGGHRFFGMEAAYGAH